MTLVVLPGPADFTAWRDAARRLVEAGVPPASVRWRVGGDAGDLFEGSGPASAPASTRPGTLKVPARFLEGAERVVCHRDPGRFALLYRMLHRLQDTPRLLDLAADPDVHAFEAAARTVRRDRHKMTAFVRFREVDCDGVPVFVAWFEPDHHIVALTAPFFVRRFAGMRWSILTPELCAHWDLASLTFTPGADRSSAPEGDRLEALWRVYYAGIFNPARLKQAAMRREMPKKYWKNLPEADLIPALEREANRRMERMVDAAPTLPPKRAVAILARAPVATGPRPAYKRDDETDEPARTPR